MNYRSISFAAGMTSLVGVILGYTLAHVFPTPYTSEAYQRLANRYAIAGGITGLLLGASQEAIRQLKQQQDEEEEWPEDREPQAEGEAKEL